MSIKAINWVWQNSPQKGGALLVELAIADFADDHGRAWPGIETLAKKARMTARNVNYIIEKKLKPGGLIVEKNAGQHRANLYRLCITWKGETDCTLKTFQDESHFPQTLKPVSPNPSLNRYKREKMDSDELNPDSVLSHSKKRKHAVPDPATLAAFEAFYQAFPKRVGREEALKAWLKLNPTAELTAAIMAGVERYATGVQGTERRYIKQPAAWLNGKRWTDEFTGSNNGNGHTKPAQVKDLGNGMMEVDGVQMDRRTYEKRYGQAAV